MSAPRTPEGWPDLHTWLLPARAYLLSFQDQTVPTRRAALADASAYIDEFDNEEHGAQLALLGLLGEALQVVEDVGVLANSLMSGFGAGLGGATPSRCPRPRGERDHAG